jgi:small nuclear ribonucleoprotein
MSNTIQDREGFYSRSQAVVTSDLCLSQAQPKRPLTTLQKGINKKVTVRLKSEIEYKGKMNNVDSYMNLIMTDAEEISNGKVIANYGRVIVRGNNVLFIRLENEL